MIKFTPAGVNEAGEKVYTLEIDGQVVRRGLTIDQAVEAINARDEERLGWDHAARGDGGDG